MPIFTQKEIWNIPMAHRRRHKLSLLLPPVISSHHRMHNQVNLSINKVCMVNTTKPLTYIGILQKELNDTTKSLIPEDGWQAIILYAPYLTSNQLILTKPSVASREDDIQSTDDDRAVLNLIHPKMKGYITRQITLLYTVDMHI